MSLKVENLCKSYERVKKKDILKNINLEIKKGEICSIIGVNGVGKTTLIKCILGLSKLDSGQVSINGLSLNELKKKGSIGYLPEFLLFLKNINLEEYLNDIAIIKGMDKKIAQKRIEELIKEFGLYEHRKNNIMKFSKGMKRRVGFIQSILNNPKILILDEPTDGLDPYWRRKMLEHIKKIADEETVILVTSHILADLEMISDKVVVMEKGQILKEIESKDFKYKNFKLKIYMKNNDEKEIEIDEEIIKFSEEVSGIQIIKNDTLEDIYLKTLSEKEIK